MSSATLRCLILGRDPSGESHTLLTFLEPQQGLERCLIRLTRNKTATLPMIYLMSVKYKSKNQKMAAHDLPKIIDSSPAIKVLLKIIAHLSEPADWQP
jgi:recombinational DNA repair protein (RecF pathway)